MTERSRKTIVSTYYRIRESSQRSRHNKYPKSSKISPHSQIVNKTHFNVITLSMSKYQKRVLTSGVPTQIMRTFLKFLMRASRSDTQNVWCVHPSDIWSRVRLTKLPTARFLSVLCYVLKIPNTVFTSQTAQTVEKWISQNLIFCGYRRPRQETCGTVRRYRRFGRTYCWKSLKNFVPCYRRHVLGFRKLEHEIKFKMYADLHIFYLLKCRF